MKIEKYKDKKGEIRYKFRAFLGKHPVTGKQVRVQKGGFLTKAQAKAEYLRLLNDKDILEKKEYTFFDVYQKWLVLYKTSVKESTLMLVERTFDRHILPEIGEVNIKKITIDQVQSLIFEFAENLQLYRRPLSYLKKVFEFAKKLELIGKNPCDFVVVPRKSSVEERPEKAKFWTSEELSLFLNIIEKDLDLKWQSFFRLLALTGMRKGEILALNWSDVDFIANKITISKSMTRTRVSGKEIGDTKTKSGNRMVDVDEKTIFLLKKWRVKQNRITEIVFTNDNFDYYIHSYPGKVLNRIIKKHGLTPITIHAFRHTHCSLLFESGASMKEVQERLGHSDIQTTMNVYAHVSQKKKTETVDRFVSYLSK